MSTENSVVVVVQARMSSSRFPGKMLTSICGEPLAVRVCRRASLARNIRSVVLATSEDESDTPLATTVSDAGFPVFRGSLDDVLTRFYNAARTSNCNTVVRITGDCPLLDPTMLDNMIVGFFSGHFDYGSNTQPPTYPDGFDIEIMTMTALAEANNSAAAGHQREHVTPYLREHPERFRTLSYRHPSGKSWAHLKCCIDTKDDARKVEALIAACNLSNNSSVEPSFERVAKCLAENPQLETLLTVEKRNDGALKSLKLALERLGSLPTMAPDSDGILAGVSPTRSSGKTWYDDHNVVYVDVHQPELPDDCADLAVEFQSLIDRFGLTDSVLIDTSVQHEVYVRWLGEDANQTASFVHQEMLRHGWYWRPSHKLPRSDWPKLLQDFRRVLGTLVFVRDSQLVPDVLKGKPFCFYS